MTGLSRVCRDQAALDELAGAVATAHRPCTGCGCSCHHVPAPAGFRALVEAHTPQTAAPSPDGAGEGAAGTATGQLQIGGGA